MFSSPTGTPTLPSPTFLHILDLENRDSPRQLPAISPRTSGSGLGQLQPSLFSDPFCCSGKGQRSWKIGKNLRLAIWLASCSRRQRLQSLYASDFPPTRRRSNQSARSAPLKTHQRQSLRARLQPTLLAPPKLDHRPRLQTGKRIHELELARPMPPELGPRFSFPRIYDSLRPAHVVQE